MFSLNQQMAGQELRGAGSVRIGVFAPVPSITGLGLGQGGARSRSVGQPCNPFLRCLTLPRNLPGADRHPSRHFQFRLPHRVARQSLDAASVHQPKHSSSIAPCDGQHHHRKAAHELGEISQELGNV